MYNVTDIIVLVLVSPFFFNMCSFFGAPMDMFRLLWYISVTRASEVQRINIGRCCWRHARSSCCRNLVGMFEVSFWLPVGSALAIPFISAATNKTQRGWCFKLRPSSLRKGELGCDGVVVGLFLDLSLTLSSTTHVCFPDRSLFLPRYFRRMLWLELWQDRCSSLFFWTWIDLCLNYT